MTQRDQKGSLITVTFTINLGQCVHARVVVYMHLILSGLDKISPMMAKKACKFASVPRSLNLAFIRESKFGMHLCWMHVSDTDDRTDTGEMWRARRKEKESIVDRHTE